MDSVNVAKSVIIDSLSLCNVLIEVEVGLARVSKNKSSTPLRELHKQFTL